MAVIADDAERAEFDEYWPDFQRILIGDPSAGRRVVPCSITELVARSNDNPSAGVHGILIRATDEDGLTWTAEAATRAAQRKQPGAEVIIFGGAHSEGGVPAVQEWLGTKRLSRLAHRTGVLPRHGTLRRISLYGFGLGAFITGTVLSIVRPLSGLGPTTHRTPQLLLAGGGAALLWIARRIEARVDGGTERRAQLTEALATSLASEPFNAFIKAVVGEIEERKSSRIIVVDDYSRLTPTDRAVLGHWLASTGQMQWCPWEYWIIIERDSATELSPRAQVGSRATRLGKLHRLRLQPLSAEKRRELAQRRGTPAGAEHIHAVKRLVQARGEDEAIFVAFSDAVGVLGLSNQPFISTHPLHLLWLLSVGASAGEPVAHSPGRLASELSTDNRRNRLLTQLFPSGRPTLTFVRRSLEDLRQNWPNAFQTTGDPEPWVLLRPEAAAAIVSAANQCGFGNPNLAHAYWALYWHDKSANEAHPARLVKLIKHLLRLQSSVSNLDDFDRSLDGSIGSAMTFALTQSLTAAQISHVSDLAAGITDCTSVARATVQKLTWVVFHLTRDPIILSPRTQISDAPEPALMLLKQRFQRMESLTEHERDKLVTILHAGRDPLEWGPWAMEEYAFLAILELLGGRDPSSEPPVSSESITALRQQLVSTATATFSLQTGRARPESSINVAETLTACVALSHSIWACSLTAWAEAQPSMTERRSHIDTRQLDDSASSIAEDIASAGLIAAGLLETRSHPEDYNSDWSIATAAAAQELALLCILGHELITTAAPHLLSAPSSHELRELLCPLLFIDIDASLTELLSRAELNMILWNALGLEQRATDLSQKVALAAAALRVPHEARPSLSNALAKSLSDQAWNLLVQAIATHDNAHLQSTYYGGAVWLFYQSSASLEYRIRIAIQCIIAIHYFQTSVGFELIQRLLDDSGFWAFITTLSSSALTALLFVAFAARPKVDTDAKFSGSLQRLAANGGENAVNLCAGLLAMWDLEHKLMKAEPFQFADFISKVRFSDALTVWLLHLVLPHRKLADDEEAILDAAQQLLVTLESREERPDWNQVVALVDIADYFSDHPQFDSALALLSRHASAFCQELPIWMAREIEMLLYDKGMPMDFDDLARLDVRELQQALAEVFPKLQQQNRHFEILDAYVRVLSRYGLELGGSENNEFNDTTDCAEILALALKRLEPLRPLTKRGISQDFMTVGRCIASSTDDSHEDLRADMNRAAQHAIPAVLKIGIALPKIPDVVSSILKEHARASETLFDQ